jgi:beta-galactosidase/beta-glucuronidase
LGESQGGKSPLPSDWEQVVDWYIDVEFDRRKNTDSPILSKDAYSTDLKNQITKGSPKKNIPPNPKKFFEINDAWEVHEKARIEAILRNEENVAKRVYQSLSTARKKEVDLHVGKKIGATNGDTAFGFFVPYSKFYLIALRELVPEKIEQLEAISS